MFSTGPLFTERTNVLPQDLVESQSREMPDKNFPISLTFETHIGSSTAEVHVELQSDTIIIKHNLRVFTIFGGETSYRLVNGGPRSIRPLRPITNGTPGLGPCYRPADSHVIPELLRDFTGSCRPF